LSEEAPRKDLEQRTRELLIYSGLRPDQQARTEGVLNPNIDKSFEKVITFANGDWEWEENRISA
jgi:hypothetical protein